MFRWFENRLDPFPAEEPVEPPKTLVAFCLHYTRGAWPYIVVAALLIAGDRARRSVDVRLPRQHRRLAVGAEPRDLPADRGLEARRHGVRRRWSRCRAWCSCSSLFHQQTLMGNYPDAHPLAGAPLPAQAVDDLLPGRVRRPHRHQADADGARRARMRHQADRRAQLRHRLFPRHAVHRRLGRLAAGDAARRLARRLHHAAALLHPAARQGLGGAGRRALDDDRPRRRQLHQHPDGEAVLACAARGRLRARGHGRLPRHGLPVDAAGDAALRLALRPQLAAAVLGRRAVDLAVARRGGRRSARWRWSSAWCSGSGACRNGSCGRCRRCSRISARCRTASARSRCRALVEDRPGAKEIVVSKGEIDFDRDRLPLRQGQGRHRGSVADVQAGREGRPRRPLRRRQVDAGQSAAALLRPRKRHAS